MKTTLFTQIFMGSLLNLSFAGPAPHPLRIFSSGSDLDTASNFVGWAKNGSQIALLNAQPWEAEGFRKWKLELINLDDDKVMVSTVINPGGSDDPGQDTGETNTSLVDEVVAIWAKHGPAIDAICAKYGVTRAKAEVHRFPALLGRHRGEVIDVSLASTMKDDPLLDYRGVQQLKVTAATKWNQSKSKVILNKTWDEFYPLAAGVIGYIPNPDNSRIAVIIGLVERGYEGSPHIRKILIIGSRTGEKF